MNDCPECGNGKFRDGDVKCDKCQEIYPPKRETSRLVLEERVAALTKELDEVSKKNVLLEQEVHDFKNRF